MSEDLKANGKRLPQPPRCRKKFFKKNSKLRIFESRAKNQQKLKEKVSVHINPATSLMVCSFLSFFISFFLK